MAVQPREETSSPSPAAEPTPAQQLQSDFKARVQAGLEKAGVQRVEDDVRNSDVLEEEAPPPPKAKPAGAASSSTKGGAARPASGSKDAEDSKDSPSSSTAPAGGKTAEDDRPPPQPRYDAKSFSKWIENNPDKAAELALKTFKVQLGGDAMKWKNHFIAAENKRRRQSEQDESERTAIAADRAAVEKLAKEAVEPVQPILDLLEAEQKEDFPAIDRFIKEAFNIEFDEYCRRRLRGMGKETVTERALKQKVQALEAKLNRTEPAAPTTERAEAPRVSDKWIEREIPKDHGARDLSDWKAKVTAAYEASKDPDSDDYSMSIEEAADKVLADFLDKRKAPAPKNGRPRTETRTETRRPAKVWTDDDEDGQRTPTRDVEEPAPAMLDYAARTRYALDRAAKRAAR